MHGFPQYHVGRRTLAADLVRSWVSRQVCDGSRKLFSSKQDPASADIVLPPINFGEGIATRKLRDAPSIVNGRKWKAESRKPVILSAAYGYTPPIAGSCPGSLGAPFCVVPRRTISIHSCSTFAVENRLKPPF